MTFVYIAVAAAVGFGAGRIGKTSRAAVESTLASLESKGVTDVKSAFAAIRAKL